MAFYDDENEYFCPNCDAILNDQPGFDPELGVWTCTECGQELYSDNIENTMSRFEGVIWHCDSCGKILNTQYGFSDTYGTWVCTECGFENSISEDNIYPSAKAYRRQLRHERFQNMMQSVFDEIERNLQSTSTPETTTPSSIPSPTQSAHKKSKILFVVAVLALSFFAFTIYYEAKALIQVGYSSVELTGQSYEIVEQLLVNSGFSYVHTSSVADLSPTELSKENLVTDIKIAWSHHFNASSYFPSNFPVNITYHTVKPILSPLSSKEAKTKTPEDLVQLFSDAGFINVKVEAIYDVITGWITPAGKIKSVSIGGQQTFDSTDSFRPDDEVVITYHTYKKDKAG